MDKICEFCQMPFVTNKHSSKYCSENCKDKQKIIKSNQKWAKKEEVAYKPKPLDQAERFHYGYAYRKSEPKGLKRFKAVRG